MFPYIYRVRLIGRRFMIYGRSASRYFFMSGRNEAGILLCIDFDVII